ncbi:MAG: NACHT domain-containing protein [Stenomitos rutilans HA7619-LM2]|jgi:hypothetical protein|nr:NACHT domain-containing protein [Stenomitos rutilans HA7619-LM2]
MREDLQAVVKRIEADSQDEAAWKTITAALQAGQVLAFGERSVAVGGSANEAVIVPGDNNRIVIHQGASVEEMRQVILEVMQAWQGVTIAPKPPTEEEALSSRLSRLEKLYQNSRDLCIQRFWTVLLDIDEATNLADDPSIGVLPDELSLVSGAVVLLVGELGIGKTLLAQRLFQQVIKQAQENEAAPIPIYLESGEWKQATSLKQVVESAASDLGDPATQGAIVILDGLDEVDSVLANQILGKACLLATNWRNTTVVISSRPTRITDDVKDSSQIQQLQVQPLSELKAHLLIERVSKLQLTAMICSGWTKSLRDAIRRPLFALILARYLGKGIVQSPRSTGELLSWFVEDALEQVKADYSTCYQFLKQLASLSIDRGGGWIRATDVDSTGGALRPLLSSRLVVERSRGLLSFPLQILTEWFAARSLADNPSKVEALVTHPQQLENWRYPLTIAIASFGEEIVFKLLQPIVQNYPTFAAEIILKASTRWGGRETPLPPFKACGEQIQTAMKAWVQGLGPLAPLIAPIREDGAVRSLGVKTDGTRLEAAWYRGSEALEAIVLLPSGWSSPMSRERDNWLSGSSSHPGGETAWAWRWTLSSLVSKLERRLERPTLLVENESLNREAAWRAALAIIRHGKTASYNHQKWWGLERIPLVELEAPLAFIEDQAATCWIVLSDIAADSEEQQKYYLKHLRQEITRLQGLKASELCYPWIGPDLPQGQRLWELYSPQQLSARIQEIYKAALDLYQQMIETWFQALKPGLEIAAMLPARLVGNVSPTLRQGFAGTDPPDFYWFLEALPEGQPNDVEINISEDYIYESEHERMESALRQLSFLRPKSTMWIRYLPRNSYLSREHFFSHSPATALAYSWLKDDLTRVFGFGSFVRQTRF